MLGRILGTTLVMVFLFAGLASGAAEVSVGNTNQKGSLLIFPKIQTAADSESGTIAVDTIVYLNNDNSVGVNLKCFWVDANQIITDFEVTLPANQPLAISARTGSALSDPGSYFPGVSTAYPPLAGNGQLLCWAVDANFYAQIQFNHLYGTALIKYSAPAGFNPSPVPSAVSYNAYAFKALKDPRPGNGGTVGLLPLDGKTYDACPNQLIASYTPGEKLSETLPVQAELTLSPCRQDLREDRTPTCTKASFRIWNAKTGQLTGAYQCLADWYEGFLEKLGDDPSQKGPGFGGGKFTFESLDSIEARIRVEHSQSTSACSSTIGCSAESQVASPLLGVLTYQLQFPGSIPDRVPFTAYALQGAGADTTGFVRWDPPDPHVAPVAVTNGPWSGMLGATITFDGSGSYDVNACNGAPPCLDEQIVSYEWDLNGDGIFNGPDDGTPVVAGDTSKVTKTFPAATTATITLRVKDSTAMVGEVSRALTVLPLAIVIDKDYEVCSETPVTKKVKKQVVRFLFKNVGGAGTAESVRGYLTSAPSNFTKIIGSVAQLRDDIEPGAEVWSPCDEYGFIQLKLDKRVTNPTGEWLWRVNFTYEGSFYEFEDVPVQ